MKRFDGSAHPGLTVARALGTTGDERITLAGEFDVYTGRMAAEELQPHDPRTRILELDLTRVTFIDATGIQAMVRALHRARQLDYELRITGVSPAVARLLRLVGLRQLLPEALEAPDVAQLNSARVNPPRW
jgi:anti-sigma B factor antagonist